MSAVMNPVASGISPEDWRQEVIDTAKSLSPLFLAAEDLGESGDGAARILEVAEGGFNVWLDIIKAEEAPTTESADAWLDHLYTIQSQIEGAAALSQSEVARASVLQAILQRCAALAIILDMPPLPESGLDEYRRTRFLRGKAVFEKLLAGIEENSAASEYEAQYRDRDQLQNTKAADACIEQLRFDYDAQEGFAATLTGLLSILNDGLVPSLATTQQLTYEDWTSGPDTVYANEEDEDEPPTVDAPLTGWRLEVSNLLAEVKDMLEDSSEMHGLDSAVNGGFVRELMHAAVDMVDSNMESLRTLDADDFYKACFVNIQALVIGACHMPETVSALPPVLRHAVELLAKADDILNDAEAALSAAENTNEEDAPPTPAAADVSPSEATTDVASEHPAASWVEQVLALSTLLRPVLLKDCASRPGVGDYVVSMLDDVEAALSKTAATTNQPACLQAFGDVNTRLGLLLAGCEDFMSPLAWGLVAGMERTLKDGEEWVRSNDFPSSTDAPAASTLFTDPMEQRLDELLTRLDAYLEALEHVGIGEQAYNLLHKIATPSFWDARQYLNEHRAVDVIVTEITHLRAGLMILEPNMGDYDPGIPLVHACTLLIRAFLDEGDGNGGGDDNDQPPPDSDGKDRPSGDDPQQDFPGQERIDVAASSAAFISRLVDYFQTATHPGTMGDLAAIHEGASVIMSALSDPVEGEDSLRARLEGALESASVILRDQPPAYWKNPGILRDRDVGKRVVETGYAA